MRRIKLYLRKNKIRCGTWHSKMFFFAATFSTMRCKIQKKSGNNATGKYKNKKGISFVKRRKNTILKVGKMKIFLFFGQQILFIFCRFFELLCSIYGRHGGRNILRHFPPTPNTINPPSIAAFFVRHILILQMTASG